MKHTSAMLKVAAERANAALVDYVEGVIDAAEKRIAETENDKSRMVDAMHAAVALNSAGISLNDFEGCVLRLHEWGSQPDYCIALYTDFIHGFVSENKLLDFGYINDNGAFAARQAEKRIAVLEARERHNERQRVIDGLAAAGEPWEEIQEHMKVWDEVRAAGINPETGGE